MTGKDAAQSDPTAAAKGDDADDAKDAKNQAESGEDRKKPLAEYLIARNFLLGAGVIGYVLPLIFAAQAGSLAAFAPIAAVGVGIVTASMFGGGLLGFLFGIPTALQGTQPTVTTTVITPGMPVAAGTGDTPANQIAPVPLYLGNTSLEQISDWLTKILVGVGLTQLSTIPTALADLGEFLAGGLGDLPGAEIFAPAIVVLALLDGFFLAYLWTRIHLGPLLAESDVNQRLAAARQLGQTEGEKKAFDTAAAVAPSTAGPAPARAIDAAAPAPNEPALEGLWVDDNPVNNDSFRVVMERGLNLRFSNATNTDDAMNLLSSSPGRFAFVISDMSRPPDRTAGFTLLRRMREADIRLPAIIFAAAASIDVEIQARNLGAEAVTNSPSQLTEIVKRVVERTRSAYWQQQPKPDEPATEGG